MAVHEGHINRSKIGNALISETVTVFVTILAYFSSFRCSIFLKRPNKSTSANKQTKVNLIDFGNIKVIHELKHIELSYFCTCDAVDAISNICSTY